MTTIVNLPERQRILRRMSALELERSSWMNHWREIQEVILPRKTVLELGKLLEDSDAEVKIDLLANQVRFRFGNIELVSKVVDGKFPDYTRVIPTGH